MSGAARERQHVVEQDAQRIVEAPGDGLQPGEPCHHLRPRRPSQGRRRRVVQPVDERVDGLVAERTHLVWVELERIGRVADAS